LATAYRSSKRVIDLARHGGHPERDKLDRRRSTKLTVPPSSDARPLVYHTIREALSTALFRRAGQLAIADSCLEHRGPLYLSLRPNVRDQKFGL